MFLVSKTNYWSNDKGTHKIATNTQRKQKRQGKRQKCLDDWVPYDYYSFYLNSFCPESYQHIV